MAMPAGFRTGGEAEFSDPHVRFVDLDGCNSLWTGGHDGSLSVDGVAVAMWADSATSATMRGGCSPVRTSRLISLHSRWVRRPALLPSLFAACEKLSAHETVRCLRLRLRRGFSGAGVVGLAVRAVRGRAYPACARPARRITGHRCAVRHRHWLRPRQFH